MLLTTYSTTRALSLALLAGLALGAGGCQAAFIGNFLVIGLTLGIFFGTLGLGRVTSRAPSAGSSASQSHSDV